MEERIGFAALREGFHRIGITWFNAAGGLGLEVYWKGPGVEKQAIPADILFH